MPPIDDEDDFADVNVTAAVDKLRAMPFEAALKGCKELRAYAAELCKFEWTRSHGSGRHLPSPATT